MSNALAVDYHRRGVHVGIANNWIRFFRDADTDGTGRLTFEELDEAVRGKLHASVSRYELRVLWRRVDINGSGLATLHEFARVLYRISLASWPDLPAPTIEALMSVLNAAADKYHHAGGNWFKIFKQIDADGTRTIAYDELLKYIRAALPAGLRLSTQELSDSDMQGLWKAIDKDGAMDVPLNAFMLFTRKLGASLAAQGSNPRHSLKNREQSAARTRDAAADIAAAPQLEEHELGAVATKLSAALHMWLKARGMDTGVVRIYATSPRFWDKVFDVVNTDRSYRLTYPEFESAVNDKLRCKDISGNELKAFWRAVDANGSGEVTRTEFGNAVYTLELRSWPELDDGAMERTVRILNAAADHYYRCSGNWFKVFVKIDEDGSGEMEFEELVGFLRRPYPCLGIPPSRLGDHDIRGFWRALDDQRTGRVATRQFTGFMRHHGKALSFHKRIPAGETRQQQLDESRAGPALPVPERTREQLQATARALEKANAAHWRSHGVHFNAVTSWAEFFRECDTNGSKRLTFHELVAALRTRMGGGEHPGNGAIIEGVSQDDLRALWGHVDANASGEVTAKEWWLPMYRLDLETWPDADEPTLARVVDQMNQAAEQRHQARGNWYKVFRILDCDQSGTLAFDELRKIVRRPLPCLAITDKQISEADLKSVWKALDADQSGEVSLQEFMVFMRRHGAKHSMHRRVDPRAPRMAYSRMAMGFRRIEPRSLGSLSPEELESFGKALKTQSTETLAAAYKAWKLPWEGLVSEWELLEITRKLLGLPEQQFDDDAVAAVWSSLDREGVGQIRAEALLALGPDLCDATHAQAC